MSDDETESGKVKSKLEGAFIDLRVSDGKSEVTFRVKRTMPFKRLMEAFCKRQDKKLSDLRFLFDGEKIAGKHTPEQLDMENDDLIEVHGRQDGGSE